MKMYRWKRIQVIYIAFGASVAFLDCQHEKANSKETGNLIIINCCDDVLSSSNITYSVSEVF